MCCSAALLSNTRWDGSATLHHGVNIIDINQYSQNIIVLWDNLDIDVNEVVNFLRPNRQSLALNRVLSADGTQINGQLNANGRVFVLDANGILFGQDAQVNVGSLVASTLDFAGDGLLNVQLDESALNALAENHGLIKADGGQVMINKTPWKSITDDGRELFGAGLGGALTVGIGT
ncbi:filamentous hemagglutinin N-terminal domain-containing protein [Gilvimarinus chinensis]|uniref:two-partner secretion domain-containing protein n=1 Tax=Gilvimarinus chinensis TaxID=396005 RepID=UPI00037B5120|nr:filamentous hemagglutinin N-terminal domain-containing protein [Gilvimarinus chinensis]